MHYIKGKGVFEASGKCACSKRELDLRLARIHGHNGDLDSFTRLIIESRVAATHLKNAYRSGVASQEAIAACEAHETNARKVLYEAVESTKRAREKYEELFLFAEKREVTRLRATYLHSTK